MNQADSAVYNPPQQQRSSATLEVILDTAAELLGDNHFDDVSVHRIAAKAGVSVGSFYARFPTKDALLATLYMRYLDRTEHDLAALADRLAGTSFEARTRAVIDYVIDRWTEERGLVTSFLLHFRLGVHPVAAEFDARLRGIFEDWAKLLAGGAAPEAWTKLRPAAESAMAIILSTLREEVLFEARTPMGPKRDHVWSTLVEELATMVSRRLESVAVSA